MDTQNSHGIMVSVCCLTYNQVNYIKDTIEGFLMQKTDFTIEIIIHDDASTDGTTEIIMDYSTRHPDLIVPILQSKNQYSTGGKPFTKHLLPRLRGKYIAYCDGDDYWTDPMKLQKQFDFLENNEDYILCTHNHSTLHHERGEKIDKVKYDHSFSYDLNFYLKNQVTPTLTSFFRNIFRDYSYLSKDNMFTDFFVFFELLKHGKGFFMADNMATYRVHKEGVCSGLSEEQSILNHIIMFKHLYKYNSWLFQIRPQIARYYLIHFNYALRVKKNKWPVWGDLKKYIKYESGFFRLTRTCLLYVPFYLIKYWLPNVLTFTKA